jgi:hypothetical protein
MTASSMSPGASATLGCVTTPSISRARGLTATSRPVYPPATRLWSSSPPTVPRRREAPTTRIEAGRSTCVTAATAASRRRASKRRRPSGERVVGKVSSSWPATARTSTVKPDRRTTSSILWLAASTLAVNVSMPSAAAASARSASSVVAMPCPSQSPATANAASAVRASIGAYMAWPTTRSSAPVVATRARPPAGAASRRADAARFVPPPKKRK